MHIFKLGKPLFAAAALLAAFLTFSASAGGGNDQGEDEGNVVKGVPGPVAGTGLVGVAVVGGYLVWRRRRKPAQK